MAGRRFFGKVYLGFWTAILLVLATLFSLDWLTSTGPHFGFPRHFMEDLLTLYGRSALACLGAGDDQTPLEMAARLEERPGLRAYLLGPRGEELDGRRPSEELRRLATQARESGPREARLEDGRPAMAVPLEAPDGRSLVAVGELAARRGPPPDEGSLVRALRLAGVLLVSALVCYFFARHLASPLLKLAQVTRRFTAGDLSARVGDSIGRGRDELAEVAAEFDRMADHLESLLAAQRQLLGDVSHELRSPLARLNVALELARRQSGPQAESALERIESEARTLNELIGQILTYNRLDTGRAAVRTQPLDLARLVRQVAEDAAFEAQGRGRSVRVGHCQSCLIKGDGELMRRAVENVVRNALHYTRSGGEVLIELRCADIANASLAEISVRDQGPGVPDDDLPYIFRPFYRVSDARERQTGGTGLGLAITERAVSLHHGAVWASNLESGGLQVVILLPLASAPRLG